MRGTRLLETCTWKWYNYSKTPRRSKIVSVVKKGEKIHVEINRRLEKKAQYYKTTIFFSRSGREWMCNGFLCYYCPVVEKNHRGFCPSFATHREWKIGIGLKRESSTWSFSLFVDPNIIFFGIVLYVKRTLIRVVIFFISNNY